jgi:hypothetical protein
LKKAGPSDKTIPATKAPTIKAAPKEQPAAAESDSAVLDFEFDAGAKPASKPAAKVSAQTPTERLHETITDARRSSASDSNGAESADDEQPEKLTEPVEVRLPGDEDEEEPASNSSDDDLNDFLKSLGG